MKQGTKDEKPWKPEFYILPNTEANEFIGKYLAELDILEEHMRCMMIPGHDEKQFVYAVSKDVMDNKVGACRKLRNMYTAFVRKTKDGKLYRYRTPEQIVAAKNRRAKKLVRRGRMTVVN